MKKTIKLLAPVLVLAVILTGCGKAAKKDDKDAIVAVVNGQPILIKELLEQYDREKKLYGITEDMESSEELADSINQFKLDVLDNIIHSKVLFQKAEEKGFKKGDEHLNEAKAFYDQMINELASDLKRSDNNSDGQKDFEKEARDYINDYIKNNGWDLDAYLNDVADQIFIDKFLESLVSDITADEAELKEYYDQQFEKQTESGYTEQGQVSIVVGDQVRIKYILVELPYEVITEYSARFTGGDTKSAEEYIRGKLDEIKPEADEINNRLKNGESFEDLLEEVNPGIWTDELKDGYLLQRNDPNFFDIEDAAFQLKKDQVSDLIETPFGYFIVKAYELIDAKTYSFEEKKAEIETVVVNNKKDEKVREIIDSWIEQSEIEIFEDMIYNNEK